jgi:glycosyltransferase involved in cell wall biosynthesis
MLEVERHLFPGWEHARRVDRTVNQRFIARERDEWEAADAILAGSEYVVQSIGEVKGPVQKCVVVPYGIAFTPDTGFQRGLRQGALRVLTVGLVGLTKGSPYILQAAKRLRGTATFRLVGPIAVSARAAGELARYVELTGPVLRSEVQAHFFWADVFLLPSLSEGSATVVYEALAAGLPVICTPNTGSVVRDSVDGYIVPIRDTDAIVKKVAFFASDPALRREMSHNARQRAEQYSLAAYSQRLLQALSMAAQVQ